MLDLTFGEQVKIILSRKGMTIKELAEMIEEQTGKRMSRQNLTQRLGRDNFQEQDMRMIASILDCPFQLNILGDARQPESEQDSASVTEAELQRLEKKKEKKHRHSAERDITIGELVDLNRGLDQLLEEKEEFRAEEMEWEAEQPEEPQAAAAEAEAAHREAEPAADETVQTEEEQTEAMQAEPEIEGAEAAAPEDDRQPQEEREREAQERPAKKTRGSWRDFFQRRTRKEPEEVPEKKEEEETPVYPQETREELMQDSGDEEEDLEKGEVNPYTGHEYESNTVRIHPKRIGYVQVYDRSSHQWTDMTEWAFLGYQERKKALLGNDYEPPIYLD